jgi:hypothetical protein
VTTGNHVRTSWSPEGNTFIRFGNNALGPTALSDLAAVTATDDRRTETVLATAAREVNTQIAPRNSHTGTDETSEKDHLCTTNS